MEIINDILPWLYAVIAIVVIWLVVELVITIRKSRQTIEEVQKSLDSAVKGMNDITNELMPALKKVDPLLDRVSLSVDALNMEILRVDDIVTDVKTMTEVAAKATQSIDTVTSAPVEFVSSVADKVRRRFGPKPASKESLNIGAARAQNTEENAFKGLVDALDDAVDSVKTNN